MVSAGVRAFAPAARPATCDAVTQHVCLTDETRTAAGKRPAGSGARSAGPVFDDAAPFFVDWVTVSQTHHQPVPTVDAGAVWKADADGRVEWRTVASVRHEGSHETSVLVRSDGHRVEFSGNVSRFGRPDNLFGFGLATCLERINAIVAAFGLPPFSAGVRSVVSKREGDGRWHDGSGVEGKRQVPPRRTGGQRYAWTGARFSRLDLTANYCAGSPEDLHAVMQYLGTQRANRKDGQTYASGETVSWGGGSRRLYQKAYDKGTELRKRKGDPRLIDYCDAAGLLRFEVTAKSLQLTDLGCAFLGDYERGRAMGELIQLFNERTEVLRRPSMATDDLSTLPRHLRATARDYLAGDDCASTLSRPTFYRHRAALLPYGIDIAIRNVTPFRPRVRVVELAPAVMPSWYQLAA